MAQARLGKGKMPGRAFFPCSFLDQITWLRTGKRAGKTADFANRRCPKVIVLSSALAYTVGMAKLLTMRVADEADKNALEALQWRASLNNPGDRAALLANPDAIELPSHQLAAGGVFAAERHGVIEGFAAVLPRHDGAAELDALFVEPAFWRQGIGRVMVDHCCVYASSMGSGTLHVVANPHAKDFYSACGFEETGEQVTRFGVGIMMRKAI